MRVYMDLCCFNRPFDDQSQLRIALETESKLSLQDRILDERLELVWSYILDFENSANPFDERRETIQQWQRHAVADVEESASILKRAQGLVKLGLAAKDALHLACAITARCDVFLTTDDSVLKLADKISDIAVSNPATFVLEEKT